MDSNLEQREKLLYSEKAWAYKIKMEALNHAGVIGDMLSVEVLVEQTGESKNQIFRLVRLTELVIALFAFLMPYSINDIGNISPSFSLSVLYNEAGVTYCMITPIILGLMLIYSKDVDKATLSVISYVGFIFGLMNMVTWFGMNNDNWWMGVLHLPLFIIAFYGLIVAYREKKHCFTSITPLHLWRLVASCLPCTCLRYSV